MPVPKLPMLMPRLPWVALAVQVEPAPVTVTVPCEPAEKPTKVLPLLRVPPLWIVSMPVPAWPTMSCEGVAPAVPTTVAFGATVSINAEIAPVGTPGAVQLPGVNQLEEIAPVQLLVCARADVVASNAAATTVVANKCVRISPRKKLLHRLIPIFSFGGVGGQYLTAGGAPIYSGRDFPATRVIYRSRLSFHAILEAVRRAARVHGEFRRRRTLNTTWPRSSAPPTRPRFTRS
jgi:hypothetical protein